MIINCPECVGPFEVRDHEISELVQIECPHCRFCMILDFAAANDSSLVESGMRIASGFRTATDYRRASGPRITPVVHIAEIAEVAEVEAPEIELLPDDVPVDDRAAVAGRAPERVSPPTAVPITSPISAAPPIGAVAVPTAPPGVFAEIPLGDEDDDEGSETMVRTPGRPTLVGIAPASMPARADAVAQPATARSSNETESARNRSDVLASASPPARVAEPARTTASPKPTPEPVAARPEARPRPAKPEVPVRIPEEIKPEEGRSGALGVFLLVLLLVLATGLTLVSVLQKNTADPRPVLEDLYRQYLKP